MWLCRSACLAELSFLPASSTGQALDGLPKLGWVDLFSLESPLTCCSLQTATPSSVRPGPGYSPLHSSPASLPPLSPPSFQFLGDSYQAIVTGHLTMFQSHRGDGSLKSQGCWINSSNSEDEEYPKKSTHRMGENAWKSYINKKLGWDKRFSQCL